MATLEPPQKPSPSCFFQFEVEAKGDSFAQVQALHHEFSQQTFQVSTKVIGNSLSFTN